MNKIEMIFMVNQKKTLSACTQNCCHNMWLPFDEICVQTDVVLMLLFYS